MTQSGDNPKGHSKRLGIFVCVGVFQHIHRACNTVSAIQVFVKKYCENT